MKTLKEQVEETFNMEFFGLPDHQEQYDIEQIKLAIIRLAEAIDNINEYLNNIK